MRKTPGHNPRGFERHSWNYRVLQLRHALGWTQKKLARVMGISQVTIMDLETGKIVRPRLSTIRCIKAVEDTYADILKEYKKAPVRMGRLLPQQVGRVRLLPVEVRRPKDLDTLEEVEGDSEPMFFGRASRRKMQQVGMSVQWKAHLDRQREGIARYLANKNAEKRDQLCNNKEE